MKKAILLLFLVLFTASFSAQEVKVRKTALFNFDWKFEMGDVPNAQEVNFDDGHWRKLHLPHDFQIEQPWDEAAGGARGFKSMGEGWYRKTFKSDPAWKGKRVLLDFEGIMMVGDIWINGKKVGSTEYGYLGFDTDITPFLHYNTENVVAVRASTGLTRSSRWYTGGGIYRDVHLIVKDSVSIARHGVFITTPRILAHHAEVNVQVEIEGIRGKDYDVEIVAGIISPEGERVAETRIAAPKGSKKLTVEVPLPSAEVAHPQLWSCETPNLYTAEVSLLRDGKVVDNLNETFGIRSVEFSKDFGFKLNGEKIFLKGISNHQDLGALGVATFDMAIERQVKRLKEFGYNHVRFSHNPYSKTFLEMADKYGILVVDELIDKWSDSICWAGRKPFTSIWYKMIPEWIKRARNHPSVILWSLGNELQMREDFTGFPTGDWAVTTYKIFDVLVKRYDNTRKTTVGIFPARAEAVAWNESGFKDNVIPPELATVTEVASFNYLYPDYPEYLKHAPHMIVYQSEAATNGLAAPFFGMDHDKMVGLAYWGAIEYWGESNAWPKKGWNYSFFNHSLEPYPQAYLIKSAFSPDPIVRIGVVEGEENMKWNDVMVGGMTLSSHWNRQEGSTQNLFTYTNADEVELLLNGKSYGVQKNDRSDIHKQNVIFWQKVPYGKGGNITAIARTAGKEVARHRLETTGKPVSLKVETENPGWKANGMDLQYVKIYAVDAKGSKVPVSGTEVTFKVEGNAELFAVDNGDHLTDELYSGNEISMHNGFAMAILRSTQNAGAVKMNISANGLKRTTINLSTVE